MEETVQAFIVLLEWNENVHFFTMYEITFLVGGPWKSNVVLEKSLKNGCNYLYEPCVVIVLVQVPKFRSYLKFAHLINNKEYCWIKLSILFLSICRVSYVVVASAIKWKSVYIHLIFWVTTVYFALCFWNKRIKTELHLTNSKLTCDESKKYQYAVNFTPSKLLWLMVTSKTCWDTETFLLACITGVLSEANTPFRANCVCLAWLIKRLLCRLPWFKEVRTCRKTFEILRAKQTCQKRNSVLYT